MRRIVTGVAAAALIASIPSPADARHRRHHRHHDRVDAGDVVAAAAVAGGIAALVSAIEAGKSRKRDAAVGACSAEAESRTGGRVAEIFGVAKRGGYYEVEGSLDRDGEDFACTVRRGTIYRFRTTGGYASAN